jgi:hypothetical protein
MRRWSLVVLLALPLPAWAADTPPRKGNLYVLGVTLNQTPDKGRGHSLASYNWCGEEIVKVFREQAGTFHRQIQVRLVQAEKAT